MKKIIIIGILLITAINVNAQTYNPEKAAEYAQFWCDKRNNETSPYYDQDKWGGPYYDYGLPANGNGDCAAFVSQCLIYGGLDLSKGSNGNGGHVKPDKVIAGASELVLHLANWQNTSITVVEGYNPPANHDVGDPMFWCNAETGITAFHAVICSSLDWSARRMYSGHSTDVCDYDYSIVQKPQRLIFFHIKSAYPDNCDCDCGDPCPPCEYAPKQKHITTATSDLPTEVRAIEKITAGNAAVKVLSGQNVSFITAGTIELLPGFEVQAGGDFNTQIKGNILGVTAACNDYCDPIIYNRYVRWRDYFTMEIANVRKIFSANSNHLNTIFALEISTAKHC